MNDKNLRDNPIDLNASYYVRHSSLQENLSNEILASYQINPSASILDVGCGDGRITAKLANLANQGNVLGIDSSSSMIKFASEKFPKSKFPNLEFIKESVEEIEIHREFDLIVSFSCLHWLKDPKEGICRLSNSLKPGGEILILTYPKESQYYKYLEVALEKYPKYADLSANHTMLSAKEYKSILSKNCLEILDFHKKNLTTFYNNQQEVQNYIKGWLNSYVPLPENLHHAFLKDVSRAVLDDPTTRKENKIAIPYIALVIRAKKNSL